MTDPVREDIKKTLIETGRRLRKRANGPSPDLITALSKLGNTYYKLRHGKPAPGKPKQKPSKENMTAAQWEEYCNEFGTPGYYESLLE